MTCDLLRCYKFEGSVLPTVMSFFLVQRCSDHFLPTWEIICRHGPYGNDAEQIDVDAIEQELWSAVKEAFWKDGKPHTGEFQGLLKQ